MATPFATVDTDLLVRKTFIARAEHYATAGSTNDLARELAVQREGPLPLLIVADEQTAGRGRGTNRWWTGKGSLACSLLLDVDDLAFDPSRSSLVSLAAAVAVAETVLPLLPSHEVGVHWPNDVFVEARKLAGILVEVLSDRRLIVGIGLNANNSLCDAPQELQAKATTLLELTGVLHDRTQILLTLLGHLAHGFEQLASQPERIGAKANQLCLQRGCTLAVEVGRRLVRGRCLGIALDGGLLLETAKGQETLYCGTLREATTSGASSDGVSGERGLNTRRS